MKIIFFTNKNKQMTDVKRLLTQLVGNKNTLSNNVLFIDFTGSHEKSQLLSQMFYWQGRTKRKDGYFAKSYNEWYDEIRVKKQSVRRFARQFEEMGFLEIKTKMFNKRPTLHYRLNLDELIRQLLDFVNENESAGYQNDTGITEIPNRYQNDTVGVSNCNIPLTETTHRLDRESAHEEKETPKQQLQTDWKPAANEILTDSDAVRQIKEQSGHTESIKNFTKEYFLNMVHKGEWFNLTVPTSLGEKHRWKAKRIAGISKWILNDAKFFKRKKSDQKPEPLPSYLKNGFDYSILENRS